MILLAQEQTFAGYKAIGAHMDFEYDLVNPFSLEMLMYEPNHFFYPWVGQTLFFATWCILLGLLLVWLYVRVNDASVFLNLGLSSLGMGLTLATFFRTAFPNPGGLLLMTVFFFLMLMNMSVVLAVAAVQKLPFFGVDEKKLSNPEDGSVRPYIVYIIAAVLTLPTYFISGSASLFLFALSGHKPDMVKLVLVGMIALAGLLGNQFLPWRVRHDQAILGGTYMKELAPIFSMHGPASRGEVVLVGVATCVIYGAVLLIAQGRLTGADMIGLAFMSALALNIIRAELARSAAVEAPVQRPTRRGPWS